MNVSQLRLRGEKFDSNNNNNNNNNNISGNSVGLIRNHSFMTMDKSGRHPWS